MSEGDTPLRAGAMMLNHIGFDDLGARLHKAIEVCGMFERRLQMTGRDTGADCDEFGDYILETVADPTLEERWAAYTSG